MSRCVPLLLAILSVAIDSFIDFFYTYCLFVIYIGHAINGNDVHVVQGWEGRGQLINPS